MARKKAEDKIASTASITFRCPADVKSSLEDLAHLRRQDVSALLVELCTSFVDANKARIANFRRSAAQPIKMPTFDTVKKKAVVEQVVETASDEGGASNVED